MRSITVKNYTRQIALIVLGVSTFFFLYTLQFVRDDLPNTPGNVDMKRDRSLGTTTHETTTSGVGITDNDKRLSTKAINSTRPLLSSSLSLELFEIVDLKDPISREHDDFRCLTTSTKPAFTICVYSIKRDKYISENLLTYGAWEPHVTKIVQTTLSVYPSATFVDLGANIGYFSLLAATSGHDVVSVEPADENVDRFRKAAYVGALWDKITLLKNAISATHELVQMSESADNQGNRNIAATGKNETGKDTVRTITLSDLARVVKTETAVLKIDIEGYECRAFQKSGQLFKKVFIPYILMEWMFTVHFKEDKSRCGPKEVNAMKSYLLASDYMPYNALFPGLAPLPPGEDFTARLQTPDVIWIHKRAKPLQ